MSPPTPADVRIRRAKPTDAQAMEVAKREAGCAAWPHVLPPALLAGLPFPPRWTAAIGNAHPRASVLVVELGGSVVGFAVTRPSADADAAPDTGELDAFYTLPSAWGRGAGRALLAAALDELAGAGFVEATLWTATENHRPRRVYEAAGWRVDGAERRRALDGVEFVEVRYRRTLERRAG